MKTELKKEVWKSFLFESHEQTVSVSYIVEREIPTGRKVVKYPCEDIEVEVQFHTGALAGYRFRNDGVAGIQYDGSIHIGNYHLHGRMYHVTVKLPCDELEKVKWLCALRRARMEDLAERQFQALQTREK